MHSILARHGRQTLAAIARASYLNARQVKYGLVILIQQHLAFHSGSDALVAYYEIDWQNSYALLRLGKATKLVEDRFGKKAANVISNLLSLGHTRIGDLKEAYFPTETESGDESDEDIVNGASLKRRRLNGTQANGTPTHSTNVANGTSLTSDDAKPGGTALVNGHRKTDSSPKISSTQSATQKTASQNHEHIEKDDAEMTSKEELLRVIQDLVEHGWVMTVTETQYLSPGDMHDILHQEAIEEVNGGIVPTGTKDKDNVQRATLASKRKMRDGWSAAPEFSRRQKSGGSHSSSSNKRVKINGLNNYVAPQASTSEDDIIIRVNPEKVAVAMRTEQLVQLVEQRLGATTALVYQTMLRMLETSIPRCYEEWPDPPLPSDEAVSKPALDPKLLITARDVALKLSPDVTIAEGLDPHTIIKITRRGHVHRDNMLSQPFHPSTLHSDERMRIVDKHIQLLSDDPYHFVTWYSRSQWHVEFEEIARHMIQTEVENTIQARQGELGMQLIRALRKRGKLDERAICNALKMPASNIRGTVNDLTIQGFVQTQEIPKVDRREAKHSIHLVWYDRQRAREKLLHDTYKSMSRTLERIAYEREKVQPVLSKAERSDVIGNEEKWLSQGELEALKQWKEVQEHLLLQLFRQDDMVATLRDFHGPLISV